MRSYPPPPEGCKIIFIPAGDGRNDVLFYYTQLDAMMLASHYNIMTINGYSGNTPRGWFFGNSQTERTQFVILEGWKILHPLKDVVCVWDREQKQWVPEDYYRLKINAPYLLSTP